MIASSHTYIVRFMTLRHEVFLIVEIHRGASLSCVFLLVRKLGGGTSFLISDAGHNLEIQGRIFGPGVGSRTIPTIATPPRPGVNVNSG